MLGALLDTAVHQLRTEYGWTAIPELISRILAFPSRDGGRTPGECFASATTLGREIGRSQRTVFRYLRRLKAEKRLTRVPGSRDPDRMPAGSTVKGQPKLRAHGYARTLFVGDFARWCLTEYQRWRAAKARRESRSEQHWQAQQRAKRAAQQRARDEYSERYPALAKRAAELDERASPKRQGDPVGIRSSESAPVGITPDSGRPTHSTGPP